MAMFTNRGVILVAAEGGNYGVAPAVNATNYQGLVVYNPEISPTVTPINRDPLRGSFTKLPSIPGRKNVNIRFTTELKGSGDSSNPGTETVLGKLLKACGTKPAERSWSDGTSLVDVYWCEVSPADNATSVVPYQNVWIVEDPAGTPVNTKAQVIGIVRRKSNDTDTSVNDCVVLIVPSGTVFNSSLTHELHADDGGNPAAASLMGLTSLVSGYALMPTSVPSVVQGNSVAIAAFADSILHLAPGGVGTFSVRLADGNIPQIEFTFSCLWSDPVDQTPPADVAFFDVTPPSVCKEDLILALKNGTVLDNVLKPNFESFSFDIGNAVVGDKNLNAAECAGNFFINGREPAVGINPLVDDLVTYNPWSEWKAGESRILTLCLDSMNVGNRVSFTFPEASYSGISYTDRDGRYTYDMKITPTGDKDDEFIIIFG